MKPFTVPAADFTGSALPRLGPGGTPDGWRPTRSWVLHPEPASVARARRLARGQLVRWALHDRIDDVELLVSELVTNSLRHAWGPIRLTLYVPVPSGGLRCEIADANPARPRVRRALDHDEAGRGLRLLDLLSRTWGTDSTPAGKTVWFELRARAGPDRGRT